MLILDCKIMAQYGGYTANGNKFCYFLVCIIVLYFCMFVLTLYYFSTKCTMEQRKQKLTES